MAQRNVAFLLVVALIGLQPQQLAAQEDEAAKPAPPNVGGRFPVIRNRTGVDIVKPTQMPSTEQERSARAKAREAAKSRAKAAAGERAREVREGTRPHPRDAERAQQEETSPNANKAVAAPTDKAKGKQAEVSPAKDVDDIDGELRFRKGKGYFNFDKADLIDVVQQISKLTKQNFIIPERIKTQKVTILCERPVTTRDAYRAFLAALEINSLSLVPAGQFLKIEQRKDSVRQTIPTLMDGDEIPDNEQLVTAVIELDNVDVDTVQKVVQNLMSKDGTLQTFAPNLIILADSGSNILRIKRILSKVDIEGTNNQVHIVDIRYAAASDIAQKLTQLFETPKGKGRAPTVAVRKPAGGPSPGSADSEGEDDEQVALAKAVADDRTNKLIIVSTRRSFDRVKELIDILDVPVEEGTPQVHVHPLSNADAEEISRTIGTLTQGAQAAKTKKGQPPGASDLFEGQVKITADKSTNSLVIVATGRDYKRLSKVIDRLDVRRPQIFVEAVIMEVSLTKTLDLGLDYYTGYTAGVPGLSGDGVGLVTSPNGGKLITNTATSSATSTSATAVSASNLAAFLGFLAFRGPVLPGSQELLGFELPAFGAVLQAVQTDSDVDVLSTPHILTTDNEKAEILVGKNVPFAGSFSGGGGGGYSSFIPMVSVQRQDVALKFAVTPHVSEDRQVRMEIEQEVSDLGENIELGFAGFTQSQPVTTKKNAKTTVVVRDQQTIIMGGLISSRKTKSESKVPILGDLPIVGWLFKTQKNKSEKSNLLLILTPYIIESDDDFRRIYERKLQERREFIEYFYGGEDAFRVPIEYAKKRGSFSELRAVVKKEMQRIENGGSGSGDEILVMPRSESTVDIAPPVEQESSATGGAELAPTHVGEETRMPTMMHKATPLAPKIQSEGAQR